MAYLISLPIGQHLVLYAVERLYRRLDNVFHRHGVPDMVRAFDKLRAVALGGLERVGNQLFADVIRRRYRRLGAVLLVALRVKQALHAGGADIGRHFIDPAAAGEQILQFLCPRIDQVRRALLAQALTHRIDHIGERRVLGGRDARDVNNLKSQRLLDRSGDAAEGRREGSLRQFRRRNGCRRGIGQRRGAGALGFRRGFHRIPACAGSPLGGQRIGRLFRAGGNDLQRAFFGRLEFRFMGIEPGMQIGVRQGQCAADGGGR